MPRTGGASAVEPSVPRSAGRLNGPEAARPASECAPYLHHGDNGRKAAGRRPLALRRGHWRVSGLCRLIGWCRRPAGVLDRRMERGRGIVAVVEGRRE